MQEPEMKSLPMSAEEANIELQNAEFLGALENREQLKRQNKLPHTFGNRKERRRLEAMVKRAKR